MSKAEKDFLFDVYNSRFSDHQIDKTPKPKTCIALIYSGYGIRSCKRIAKIGPNAAYCKQHNPEK